MTIHKKLNTGSSFDLNQSQSGCCPDDGTTCRYSYVFDDDGTTLTSIVVDGVVVALDGIDPTGELADVINAITAKLDAAGYSSDSHVSITAWRGNDTLNLDFFATVVFGDLVTSGGTLTASANCIATPYCYYEIEVDVAADVDFDIEFGKPGTLVGGNIAADYSTGNGDTLEDDIVALFDGDAYEGVLLQITRVKAVENFASATYVVGIWVYRPSGGNMYLDGVLLTPLTCKPNYSKA